MLQLRINPLAAEDLIGIKKYISSELENPQAAADVIRKIVEDYGKLKEFPMLGLELSLKIHINTDFRYLISGNYIIFYRADNKFVFIYRILFAGRDYLKILFSDEIIGSKHLLSPAP